jgi:hypothetical protein
MYDLKHLEEDFQRLNVSADNCCSSGSSTIVADNMYSLEGAPELRRIFLAIVGLNELIESGQVHDVNMLKQLHDKLYSILLRDDIISADDYIEYGEAIFMIDALYAQIQCDIYKSLQKIHLEMLATELRVATIA